MSELKKCREVLGLDQVAMAALLDLHPVTVSRAERGETALTAYRETIVRFLVAGGRGEMDVRAEIATKGPIYTLSVLLERYFSNI